MAKVLLGDVVDHIKDKVDKDTTDLEFYVGGEHIDGDEITVRRRGRIEGSTIGPAFHMRFQRGDVLLMSRNPHLRKASMVNFDGICSDVSYVCRTKNNDILLQSLLPFILQTPEFWQFAEENKKGGLPFFLNWKDFARFEFELLPIDRQQQISILLWTMERVKNAYRELIAKTDDLVKSQFIEMFRSTNDNEYTWPSYKLADMYNVKSSKRIYAKELTLEGIPFLKVADVLERISTGTSHPKTFISEEKYRELLKSGLVPRTGDILVTSRGTIGKCYIVTDNDKFYFQDGMISWLQPKQNCDLLPEFITALFDEEQFLAALDAATNKTTVTYISLEPV